MGCCPALGGAGPRHSCDGKGARVSECARLRRVWVAWLWPPAATETGRRSIRVITLGTPGEAALDRTLAELAGSTPTYPDVDATAGSILPPGYRLANYSALVGLRWDSF